MTKEIEELKAELLTGLDQAVAKHLPEIVGSEEVADRVVEHFKSIKLEERLTGRDLTGLSESDKKSFASDLRSLANGEKAAYLEQSDQTGGYVVPTEVHEGILRISETHGIIARDARRWPMGSDSLEIPRYTGAVMRGELLGEDDEGDETQNDLGVARLFAKRWQVIHRLSNSLLADANVSLTDWLMAMVSEGFAYDLDAYGFMAGTTGETSAFTGLLASGDVTVQTLGSGKTGFEDFDALEAAIAIGTIKTAALSGAAFYFHPTVWAQLKGKKDGTSGIYEFSQFNEPLQSFRRENGLQPVGTIQGYPVYTTDVLPAYSTSGTSKKFGVFANINLAVAWGDRGPMEIARSNDATVGGKSLFRADQTAFRFKQRLAVAMQLPAAAVVLKTAGS